MNASQRLSTLSRAVQAELEGNILPYWSQTMDRRQGGFFGFVADDLSVDADSPKGIVMHSRHLWAYSSAWLERRNPLDLAAADHAYAFLTGPLHDKTGGGFWWTVDAQGKPGFENKVLYGQAFAIYGLSQYYRATGKKEALDLAVATFRLLEKTGRDRQFGGYYEAVDRSWTKSIVQALSEVDIPCAKSMNTNLHVLEAFSSLYLASGLPEVKEALGALFDVFARHILVTPEHLGLYFDRDWKNLTDHVSYGHDVEASWLLTEAAMVFNGTAGAPSHHLTDAQKAVVLPIAQKSLAVVQAHGGSMPNELHGGHLDTTRIWWVQAETLVGLVNGYELTGDEAFLTAAEAQWAFIDRFVVDRLRGEWFAEVSVRGEPNKAKAKGGLWKTCYHNGRACLEVIQRARKVASH